MVTLLVEGEKELPLLLGSVVPKVGTSLAALLLNPVLAFVMPRQSSFLVPSERILFSACGSPLRLCLQPFLHKKIVSEIT